MREVTLTVCQGVGDTMWVYQKFSPYVDRINFNIVILPKASLEMQTRAAAFLKVLPKTGVVGSKNIIEEQHAVLAGGVFDIHEILSSTEKIDFNYACNKPLEDGIRLEKIDEGYGIEEDVVIKDQYVDLGFDKYITLYVSGSSLSKDAQKLGVWRIQQWAELVFRFYAKYGIDYPLVILGATYDQNAIQQLVSYLTVKGMYVKQLINSHPLEVFYVLRHSTYFIGYQSGLNIVADWVNARQLMIYFPWLHGLRYSWPKQRNIQAGLYTTEFFNSSLKKIVDNLRVEL